MEKQYIYNFHISEGNFRTLYIDFYPILVVWAKSFRIDEELAEDIVQDVFIRMFERQRGQIIENVSTYLYRAVKYKCLNHKRDSDSHYKIIELITEKEDHCEQNQIIQQESVRLIYQAISQLPPRCKEIFLLSLDGIKNKEIAEQLGLAEETVKKQKKIARKSLKEWIAAFISITTLLMWCFY